MNPQSTYAKSAGQATSPSRSLLPPPDPAMPPCEMGAVQSQIQELEKCLHEVFNNQEVIEQRLVPVMLPYPTGTPATEKDGKEAEKCQVQDAIHGACGILRSLAARQRLILQNLQV
jgi:hypothetical protein